MLYAEDRHDSLVEAGAIQALVPLLTLFAPKEADAAPLWVHLSVCILEN